jgi:hypothetical protein
MPPPVDDPSLKRLCSGATHDVSCRFAPPYRIVPPRCSTSQAHPTHIQASKHPSSQAANLFALETTAARWAALVNLLEIQTSAKTNHHPCS